MVWCETGTPDLAFAKKFAEGIRKKYPEKMLAYNCSPSFNWKRNLDDATIAKFQRELGAMGYKFQFITLAGFHSLNYSMFELAHGYARNDMSAFVELQQKEFAAAEKGFTAVKHQREVGTGYFDEITQVVTARQGVDHRAARLDRGRAILRLAEKAEARRGVDFAARIARTILDGFDRHYRLFREAAVEARRLYRARGVARDAAARAQPHPDVRHARRGGGARAHRPLSRGRGRRVAVAGDQARLHRPAPRAQAARVRRDLLQLGRLRGAAPALLQQRFHLLAPGGGDRAPRGRGAELPLLLSRQGRAAENAAQHRDELRTRQPLGEPAPRPAQRGARPARAFSAAGARAARPADPGAGVALLPQQGRLHHRPRDQRAPRAARSPCRSCRTSAASSTSTRCSWARTSCWCCSRSRAPTSSSTWRCRRPTSRSCAGSCRASRAPRCTWRSASPSRARRSSTATCTTT